jgi:XRE family transcriptional regulator, fatty acid utilization regulator
MPTLLAIDPDSLGGRVRYWRHVRGLTQPELWRRTGIAVSQLSNIEWGRTGVSTERLIRLATALEVSTDVLLGLAPGGRCGQATPPSLFPKETHR